MTHMLRLNEIKKGNQVEKGIRLRSENEEQKSKKDKPMDKQNERLAELEGKKNRNECTYQFPSLNNRISKVFHS